MNKTRSALVAIGVFLLSNLKWLIGLLKWSKFGTTLISMIVSFGAYALMYGWKFGIALVYLIFVHEMGHVIAAKQKGIHTSPAVFIPFVGAFISMKELPRDAKTEAYLAYGGPFAGLLSFLPALPLYWWTHDPFWAMVISLGATINLFNLLPVSPLDGGRIVSVLSPKFWFLGLIVMAALLFVSPSPMLFIIFILGIITWWNRMREGSDRQIYRYEQEKLQQFISELETWPHLVYTYETRTRLLGEYSFSEAINKDNTGFAIPVLQDEKRMQKAKARLDFQYAELTWQLFLQWERTPVTFVNGDPLQPVSSPVLIDAINDAKERLNKLEAQIKRMSTYYEASPSTKWKVLAAYLGLAAILSVFMWYGQEIMRLVLI